MTETEYEKKALENFRELYELDPCTPKDYANRIMQWCRKNPPPETMQLIADIEAMRDAAYHSLLLATAWMGTPEKKRENFIEEHMSNYDFIKNKAITAFEQKQKEIL